jgi:hypothetical protein
VLWKRQKGADVRVVSTSTAGTSTTAIKTYLQNLYNDPTTRPDFIILLGDTAGSYAIPVLQKAAAAEIILTLIWPVPMGLVMSLSAVSRLKTSPSFRLC